jgi:hypothetical protein
MEKLTGSKRKGKNIVNAVCCIRFFVMFEIFKRTVNHYVLNNRITRLKIIFKFLLRKLTIYAIAQ